MYEVKLKNKKLRVVRKCEYNELMCDSYDDNYRVHVILPYDSDMHIDTGYDLNTVYFYDDHIELYDCVDYHHVDIHVDPNKYYIELDVDKILDIVLVVIKLKED